MRRIFIPVLLFAIAAGAYGWHLARPAAVQDPESFQGYVEGNLVYLAADEAGRVASLEVEAGDRIGAGDPAFALDASIQLAQRDEAQARLDQARAQLQNLVDAAQRPEQIAVLKAQEQQAQAQLSLTRAEFERQQTLFERNVTAKASYDQSRAAYERDLAALQVIRRQIEAAHLPGRSADIVAARAGVAAAEAALRQNETRLARRQVTASVGGRVQDVFFRPGEVVAGGQPVLAILPPGGLRFRFYVREPFLSTVRVGRRVNVTCDRCPPGLVATVSFVAREAEYTPPVIFSQEERGKLVFRVEARPADAVDLPVGLPVTVRLAAPDGD